MRADGVVLAKPLIDDDFGLFRGCEPLRVEHFMSQGSIEAFVIAILPWRAWIDMQRFDFDFSKPGLKLLSNELRPIVRCSAGFCATNAERGNGYVQASRV